MGFLARLGGGALRSIGGMADDSMRGMQRMMGGNNARIAQIEQEIAALPRAQQLVVTQVFQRDGADAAEQLLAQVRRLSAASPNPMHWTQGGGY